MWWVTLFGASAAAIDRRAVVERHSPRFVHSEAVDPRSTAFNALTVGNGEFAFTADLTGLQSLNRSYPGTGSFPLLTLSNWGWHAPDPATVGVTQPMFRRDGSLNYTFEQVRINSSDARPGKGNRTVPYQFRCAEYNDPKLCDYMHMFPARVGLGQLSFVVPSPPPPPPMPAQCTGLGDWCNAAQVQRGASGAWGCASGHQIVVARSRSGACAATASCAWRSGWHGAPFCAQPGHRIAMSGVTPGKVNRGFFDGSCDRIQWNNTFDRSAWCRSGSSACAPSAPVSDGPYSPIALDEVSKASQGLDMYSGVLHSNWTHRGGHAVQATTAVDPASDSVAVRAVAPAAMGLAVQLAFCTMGQRGEACEWRPFGAPGGPLEPHSTTVLRNRTGRLDLLRANGPDTYTVSCAAPNGVFERIADHVFVLRPAAAAGPGGDVTLELTCRFRLGCCVGPTPPEDPQVAVQLPVATASEVVAAAEAEWRGFWEGGAFADLAGKTDDPRAAELERRMVQSLYQLRAQEAGSVPLQESALLYNSWTGKHHSEMRYWHQTWMPIWGHPELLARSDEWFIERLANATAHARHQGYRGARWGKMLGESNLHGIGRGDGTRPVQYWESPNQINPGLVWHQPHVVYMAELEYRASKTAAAKAEVLHRLKGVVLGTAAFLADFPERRIGTGTDGAYLDLGPPIVSASEGESPYTAWNPTYELTQFNFSLDIANTWRERLGLGRNPEWDAVRLALAPLPVSVAPSGALTYNRHQHCLPSVFADHTQFCSGHNSHPALTGALGCLPGDRYGVDRAVMNQTLFEVLDVWSWERCWGWDEPMVAMTATRLEQPDVALRLLLLNASTNAYLATGYNHPTRSGELTAYLPGNGGTLIALGLMAGGWEGAPDRAAPGFPPSWEVQVEGFVPYF